MRKASTEMERSRGLKSPSPAPRLIPAQTSTESLHWDWCCKRRHITVKDLRFLVKGQRGPAEAVEGDTTSESDTIQECSHRASLKLRHLQWQACLSDHR